MIWKIAAAIGGVVSLGLAGFIWWFLRGWSDGMADAFGYPRKRRWRRV